MRGGMRACTRRHGLVLLGAVLLLVVSFVVVRPPPAAACSCAMTTPEASFGRAQAVFSGQLVEIVRPNSGVASANQTLRFTVDRVYKGDVGRVVEVHTARSEASCGLGIEALGSYVIFATGRGVSFSSTLCDGSLVGLPPTVPGDGAAPSPEVAAEGSTSPVGWWLLLAVGAGVALVVVRWLRRPRGFAHR